MSLRECLSDLGTGFLSLTGSNHPTRGKGAEIVE